MFLANEVIVREFSIPVSTETKQKIIQFSIDNVGAPYALGTALGIIPVKIAALFGYKIKNPVSQQGAFCSELAAIILKDYADAPFTSEQVQCMTPTDVYNYLMKVMS
jgi:hypothetical protein